MNKRRQATVGATYAYAKVVPFSLEIPEETTSTRTVSVVLVSRPRRTIFESFLPPSLQSCCIIRILLTDKVHLVWDEMSIDIQTRHLHSMATWPNYRRNQNRFLRYQARYGIACPAQSLSDAKSLAVILSPAAQMCRGGASWSGVH